MKEGIISPIESMPVHFVKFSTIILFCAGIILLVFPVSWFPSFYDVRYMGFVGLAYAVLITFLPRLLRVSENETDAARKNHAADLFQFLLIFVFISNVAGDLGLYKLYTVGFEFDKLLHLIIPFTSVIVISIILNQRFRIRKYYAIAMAFGFIILCGVVWEVYEYATDIILKTHISGVYGLGISIDTKFDLIYDVFGSVFGVLGGVFFWNPLVPQLKEVTMVKRSYKTRGR